MLELLAPYRQIMLFIAGGLLCALIDVGLLQLVLAITGSVLLATSAGFLAGLAINFLFHSKVTFQRASSAANLARYLCIVAVNYVITVAFVYAALRFHGSAVTGKIASLPVVAVNGYFLSKYWIYR